MTQYISKSALVAEIERLAEVKPIDEFQPQVQNKIDWLSGKLFAINSLRVFLDTLEVKDANEALRTEYEKGRHDVIVKTLKWLWDLNQEHEIISYTDSHVLDSEELQQYYKNNIEE
jgi:hypothetical protein